LKTSNPWSLEKMKYVQSLKDEDIKVVTIEEMKQNKNKK